MVKAKKTTSAAGAAKAAKPTADATSATNTDLESILLQAKNLRGPDLSKLQSEIQKLLLKQAMVLGALPKALKQLKGQFEVWDEGKLDYGGWKFQDIFPDLIHKYTLKWGDGEEMNIVYASQEGTMGGGMTKFECYAVQIGPLLVERAYPDWGKGGGMPHVTTGVHRLHAKLKKHGIKSRKHVCEFLAWICKEVLSKHTTHALTDALEEDELFEDYSDSEEEEEEEEDEA